MQKDEAEGRMGCREGDEREWKICGCSGAKRKEIVDRVGGREGFGRENGGRAKLGISWEGKTEKECRWRDDLMGVRRMGGTMELGLQDE